MDNLKDGNAAAVVMSFMQDGFLHDPSGRDDDDLAVIKVPFSAHLGFTVKGADKIFEQMGSDRRKEFVKARGLAFNKLFRRVDKTGIGKPGKGEVELSVSSAVLIRIAAMPKWWEISAGLWAEAGKGTQEDLEKIWNQKEGDEQFSHHRKNMIETTNLKVIGCGGAVKLPTQLLPKITSDFGILARMAKLYPKNQKENLKQAFVAKEVRLVLVRQPPRCDLTLAPSHRALQGYGT